MNLGEVKNVASIGTPVGGTGTGFKAPTGIGASGAGAPVNPSQAEPKDLLGAPKADIIKLALNIGLPHIAWYMKKFSGITIPYEVELKEIDPNSVVQQAPETDKVEVEEMVKKIVAYAADGTYTSIVPALIVNSDYLKDTYADPNITLLGGDITKATTAPIKSDLTIEYIVEQTMNVSEVYLKTADVIARVACVLAGIPYSDLVGANKKYGYEFAFNGKDAYTVTFNNKIYQDVK